MSPSSRFFGVPTNIGNKLTARDLVHQAPFLTPDHDNQAVVTLFTEHSGCKLWRQSWMCCRTGW